ncbi:HAMP domain-containing sensor histidine kinase [Robertmurraya sp. DFI.2.37]|uniref:HAMP domain-containing sensor histidine kinase n=1 Tax=Robertmurraya sp. DFI.2.37 TaxID=3031819 RepID=UPI00124484D7|nr:HAMP domain-containing sensor histidine kinase [Robertmurraya sp. DFI.2.37]MDF1509247.1 HAMP domain-containing sensor histidine kinase [Robertmurraya sp. DFI.2.37]
MKIKYLYQQLISHMGVLLVAFLIMSIVFAHYVERLVYQNTVDELVSYGENILNDITRGSRSVSNIVNEYSLVLKGRNISFSIFDQEGSLLYPSGNLRLVDEVLDQIAEGKPHVVRNRIKHSNQEVTLVALPYIMNDTLIGVILLTAPISGSREMISQINQYLFFTALLAFALAILPSWLLSKVHVNRIKRIQEATSMVSKGDYSVNLPPSNFDEIGELAQDFNHMVKKLNTAAEEIESLENRRRNFMSDVSHELRTPLTTISGVIEGLKNGMIAEEEKEKGINLVSQETKRLIRLVNENLDYDKIRSNQIKLKKEDVQLREVFEIIQEQLTLQAAEKNNQIEIKVEEDVRILADYDRLIQILINITKNSIQFTENGHICLKGRMENNHTVIEIEDTGIGIDTMEIEKIWHRFYKAEISRTNNPYGEFGLGLSIVKQLIHLHHGSVEVFSEKGKGTKFVIKIPYR